MNSTINSTLFNSTTLLTTQLQEYLENPLFLPFVFVFWSFVMTNHKYRQTLNTLKSFKNQSADEIFSLQKSLFQNCPVEKATKADKAKNRSDALGRVYEDEVRQLFGVQHPAATAAAGLPFNVLAKAVKNYCEFYDTPTHNVSLDDVSRSSAGINGWVKYKAVDTPKKVKKVKKVTTQTLSEYNLFIKKSIPDIKRDNPGIPHKLAFIQATKMWQSKKS